MLRRSQWLKKQKENLTRDWVLSSSGKLTWAETVRWNPVVFSSDSFDASVKFIKRRPESKVKFVVPPSRRLPKSKELWGKNKLNQYDLGHKWQILAWGNFDFDKLTGFVSVNQITSHTVLALNKMGEIKISTKKAKKNEVKEFLAAS